VLVLVRGARESELTLDLLTGEGLHGLACGNVAELCRGMDEGAAVALLAEEMLTPAAVTQLGGLLKRQAAWSDFPIVVFSASARVEAERIKSVSELGNITFLDRPVHVRSMLASIHAALRSRRRQYEARRAIESRDAFLAMLGHELRNPLGAISLAVSLLGQKASDKKPREYGIIERQVKHLSRLVDDLLDVARVTHGKVILKRERLDLVQLARGAFETQEPRAREQCLAYYITVPEGPLWVDGDRQRLEQVFGNLLTNAIKYTPRGGAVQLDIRGDGQTVSVHVVDTGVGLAPEMQERVFEPFAQVDTSLERAQGGLGLGLALVRSIVQLHGGTVSAGSEGLGRGSRFSVNLPQTDAAVVTQSAPPDASAEATRKRILIVEDNPDLRDLFVQLLQGAGHEVACANDGPAGLREVLALAPDIAFVDVGLPGFDGLELARKARERGSRSHLVALTGYGQAEDRKRTAEAGFDEHLVKPALDSEIARSIARAKPR
jgi:signal transduction histidine kinase